MAAKPAAPKQLSGAELLSAIQKLVRQEFPDLPREYDPLFEMAIHAADPRTPKNHALALSREIAQYIYPKRKAVEVDGAEGSGMIVQLVQFVGDGNVQPVRSIEERSETPQRLSAFEPQVYALPARAGSPDESQG